MKIKGEKLLLSPTDLNKFYESEFASWMDHYYELKGDKGPLGGVHKNPPDDLMSLLAEKGNQHEAKVLKDYESASKIPNMKDNAEESSDSRYQRTLETMKSGAPYIYQAVIKSDIFFGYADLLKKVPGESQLGDFHYEPIDMKISMAPKPTAVLQLCAYADGLEKMQGTRPKTLTVVTKDYVKHTYETAQFFNFYQAFKKRFKVFHDNWNIDQQPLPTKGDEHRDWSIYAKKVLHVKDDIQLTARIRQTHIEHLRAAGITTMTALSQIDDTKPIGDISTDALQALKRQAAIQVQSREQNTLLHEVHPHEPGKRIGLAMLPDAHPADLFFDMEGYPLLGANGLEYLYGCATRGDGETKYLEYWARAPKEEVTAFKRFMTMAYESWRANPGMHIYHYGHYEPSTLKRLMCQYGVGEAWVDDMLRAEVFVDLYQVVLQGLRVGAFSYGLKAVEKLYYPDRDTDIGSGAEAAIEYSNFLETGEEKFLDRIRDYNKDDCYSAKDLEAFLRKIKNELKIPFVPLQSEEERNKPAKEDSLRAELSRKAQELFHAIPEDKRGLPFESADPADYVQELLSHMLEFHFREEKPEWWEYFRRQDLSPDQLYDDSGALVAVKVVGLNDNDEYECTFNNDQETKFRKGEDVLILENKDPFTGLEITEWNLLAGTLTLKGKPEQIPDRPFTLVPAGTHFNKSSYFKSMLAQANAFSRTADHFGLRPAVYDLLLRKAPRIKGRTENQALIREGEDTVAGATRVAMSMEGACLCIQGPPGTGKTFTASHVIKALLLEGKSVAISSNSHKAINNLMREVDKVCAADRSLCRPVKISSYPDELNDSEIPVKSSSVTMTTVFGGSKKMIHPEGPCNVLGATVYFLCKEEIANRFDYLFVDEATQVALANLVGMSRCAPNIVLMGDQMQLGQPTQAVHPGDSGNSSLEHLANGRSILAPHEGIFLPITYRMHPSVTSVVSELFYEGALKSSPDTANQAIAWHKSNTFGLPSAGVHFMGIKHTGNSHGSQEEAEAIKAVVETALKSEFTDRDGVKHKFTRDKILIVSPYNYQVSLLEEVLGPGHRIGSVDLFQGQEAPLVLLSLCASTAKDAPRGISFLLDRNRINVALSRAKSLAVVVGSLDLANGRVSSVDGMKLMNVICRLIEN